MTTNESSLVSTIDALLIETYGPAWRQQRSSIVNEIFETGIVADLIKNVANNEEMSMDERHEFVFALAARGMQALVHEMLEEAEPTGKRLLRSKRRRS